MPFTLIYGDSFTSDGTAKKINLPGSADYFVTTNITQMPLAPATAVVIRGEWYGPKFGVGATAANDGIRWKKTNSTNAINIDTFATATASNGFTFVTTSPVVEPQAANAILSQPQNLNTDTTRPQHNQAIFTSRRMGQFGQCEECKDAKTGYNWCQYCDIERCQNNFVNWTSGCKEIDGFIQEAQRRATNVRSILEWIDYEEFTNVRHLANGGNSSVYVFVNGTFVCFLLGMEWLILHYP